MKINKLVLFLLTGSFFACSSPQENKEEVSVEEPKAIETVSIYDEMVDFNLSSYELPIVIKIPILQDSNGDLLAPQVRHEDGDYMWSVKVGDKYTLEIEDGGDLINILEEEKNRLQGTFYEIKYFQENSFKPTTKSSTFDFFNFFNTSINTKVIPLSYSFNC